MEIEQKRLNCSVLLASESSEARHVAGRLFIGDTTSWLRGAERHASRRVVTSWRRRTTVTSGDGPAAVTNDAVTACCDTAMRSPPGGLAQLKIHNIRRRFVGALCTQQLKQRRRQRQPTSIVLHWTLVVNRHARRVWAHWNVSHLYATNHTHLYSRKLSSHCN